MANMLLREQAGEILMKIGQRSICAAVLLLMLADLPASAGATEWFVASGQSGTGTSQSPFGRITDAVKMAQPGDTVTLRSGTYSEVIQTVRSGLPGAPITIRAEGARGTVIVTSAGRVLTVNHAHILVQGLVLDGQYGADDLARVYGPAAFLELRDLEMRRTSRDIIDMSDPHNVMITGCLLHHALNPVEGRSDAHGIAAGAVQNLTIRDTEIHTFSGDGVQVDPGRSAPGWSGVTIERSRIWLAPLPAPENGFPAGKPPGENAVDTKASPSFKRSVITVRDTTAWGFRGAVTDNIAAFNLKEHIDATLDRVTVHDSDIAFRLRGAVTGGAWVAVKNAVVYNTSTAFRYEDNIQNLRIWNTTVGGNVVRAFLAASSGRQGLDVRNLLVLGAVSAEAAGPSNRSVTAHAFLNASAHDYRLAAGAAAIDTGVALPEVSTDRGGTARPQGAAYDVGAYEWIRPAKQRSRLQLPVVSGPVSSHPPSRRVLCAPRQPRAYSARGGVHG